MNQYRGFPPAVFFIIFSFLSQGIKKVVPIAYATGTTNNRGTTQIENINILHSREVTVLLTRLEKPSHVWYFMTYTLTDSHQPPAFLHTDAVLLVSDTYICLFD